MFQSVLFFRGSLALSFGGVVSSARSGQRAGGRKRGALWPAVQEATTRPRSGFAKIGVGGIAYQVVNARSRADNVPGGAGLNADNVNFGDTHDFKATGEAMPDLLFSKIASITIKGYAVGTVNGSDFFGVVAEQIGAIKIGARTYTLASGTDPNGFFLGTTPDFRIHEV